MSKTILIITDNLSDQINGVNTTYKNIQSYAILAGYRIEVLSPENFYYFDCPLYKEVKISWPLSIGKKIEKINPDYIHVATEGPIGLWARVYLSLMNFRYNTAYHTKLPELLKKIFAIPETVSWSFVRWFHKHSVKVLTTTNTMVQELKSHGFRGEIKSWTRGIDRDIFYPDTNHDESKILLCVSRISKEKNLKDFFNLHYPGYRKIMVGDGPMLETYRKEFIDVEFVGYKTGIELATYYRQADVFVFPSKWETFGLVMIEAMACGTPVAAYSCSGPLDVVDANITGCLSDVLKKAVDQSLLLDRNKVWIGSQRWSWQSAWEIFRDNLVSK